MPFRLTPNFENFIGKIALHGLYAIAADVIPIVADCVLVVI